MHVNLIAMRWQRAGRHLGISKPREVLSNRPLKGANKLNFLFRKDAICFDHRPRGVEEALFVSLISFGECIGAQFNFVHRRAQPFYVASQVIEIFVAAVKALKLTAERDIVQNGVDLSIPHFAVAAGEGCEQSDFISQSGALCVTGFHFFGFRCALLGAGFHLFGLRCALLYSRYFDVDLAPELGGLEYFAFPVNKALNAAGRDAILAERRGRLRRVDGRLIGAD